MTARATALAAIQTAVFTRLNATAALTALCAIYDKVPQTKAYPYARYEDPFEEPDRTFGQGGHQGVFHIVVYSQDGSQDRQGKGTTGTKSGLDIAAIIIAALVDPCDGSMFDALTVTGHDLVDLDKVTLTSTLEDDGVTRRTEILFSYQVEDA
jgi:hypothetical protein